MFNDDLKAYNHAKDNLLSYVGKKVKVFYYDDKEIGTIVQVDLNRNELVVHLECDRLSDDYDSQVTRNNKPIYNIPFTHFNNYGLEFI